MKSIATENKIQKNQSPMIEFHKKKLPTKYAIYFKIYNSDLVEMHKNKVFQLIKKKIKV